MCVRLTGDSNERPWKVLDQRGSRQRAASRSHTCDIWLWAEPKRTAIVLCRVQAVRRHVARYISREVEEGHHIVGYVASPAHVKILVPSSATIWAETPNTWGEIGDDVGGVGHWGGGSGSRMWPTPVSPYIQSTCRGPVRRDVTHTGARFHGDCRLR